MIDQSWVLRAREDSADEGLWRLLETHAAVQPTELALRDVARAVTWSALASEVERATRLLAARGVRPGDVVLLACENRIDWVVAFLAVGRSGATLALMDTQTASTQAEVVVARCRPAAIMHSGVLAQQRLGAAVDIDLDGADWQGNVRGTPGGLDGPAAGDRAPVSAAVAAGRDADAAPAAERPRATTAVVLFTSGSTGAPKGIELSHGALTRNAVASAALLELARADCGLVFQPLAMRMNLGYLAAHLAAGASVQLEPGFVSAAGPWTARQPGDGITGLTCVPTQLRAMLERRLLTRNILPRIRYVRVGAGLIGAEDFVRLAQRCPGCALYMTYGLSETGEVAMLRREDFDGTPGCMGRPLPDVRITVLGDGGEPVQAGELGEIVVDSPRLLDGYLGEPGSGPAPGFATGDLGRLDARGMLYFVGRRKELIKVAGESVSPLAIEAAIRTTPGVAEAAVVGVPDELLGEAPVAFVVALPDGAPQPQEILAACRSRLPRLAVPCRIQLCDALPRLPSGKPDKLALAALARQKGS